MDKYEIRIIAVTVVLLAIFLVSILKAVSNYATDIPDCIPYDEAFTKAKVNKLDDKLYQVFVSAQMWSFEPSEIYIPTGSTVDFYLTSKDVVHGFHIADKNINMMAVPGGINKASCTFDEPGVYQVICHEYCGSGHQHMRGEIIVNTPLSLND